MRSLVGTGLLAASVLMSTPAAAQDIEALRQELQQMRKQFETMKEGYEKAIDRLGERIQQLETRSQPAAAAPAPPAPAPAVAQTAPAGLSTIAATPLDLARPRQPFALYGNRGPGQLLFDMGVAGDFIGNLTQRNVDKANAGTFAGQENRFFPREIELALFGQVDPYARAEVRVEAGEEDPGEIALHLAEANLTLLSLPFNTQLKMGQMRNRFGLLNAIHEHDRNFIDAPNVLRRFLGREGFVERGAELTWVAPLPFFLEALVGAFNGDNEDAFGRGKLSEPLVTGRLRTFVELGDTGAIQLGASVASGETPERRRNTLLGFDAKYKFTPVGWQHPLLTVLGEMIYQNRRVDVLGEDTNGDGVADTPDETRIRNRWGWYAGGEVQPFQTGWLSRFGAGFRYDWTQYPVMRGREWAVGPFVSFSPSEFLRFRLGYKHTERAARDGFGDNQSSARKVDEILFQATFILGAHPAHPF
ncbi:MAG TPA: hypothetical protein VKA83_20865 [Methylomirabilota bacterium]|nr:hypothetical protein [Methylomirabilota bacterium]